jgi:hypothetical protein
MIKNNVTLFLLIVIFTTGCATGNGKLTKNDTRDYLYIEVPVGEKMYQATFDDKIREMKNNVNNYFPSDERLLPIVVKADSLNNIQKKNYCQNKKRSVVTGLRTGAKLGGGLYVVLLIYAASLSIAEPWGDPKSILLGLPISIGVGAAAGAGAALILGGEDVSPEQTKALKQILEEYNSLVNLVK